ncbi:hypothetical protein QZH41_015829, partial [Actinostola sp. cb2023]
MAEDEDSFVIYVKASNRDCNSLGADIVTHRLMMMLALKELDISAKVVPIDIQKKTNVTLDFPYKKFPTVTLEFEGKYVDKDEPSEIEDAFEKTFSPPLKVDSKDINTFINVGPGNMAYQKFVYFIKNKEPTSDETLKGHLSTELRKVNSFLLSEKTPRNENGERQFLGGASPMIPDCYLLPKLHYMYVACNYVKKCEFEGLQAIDEYLQMGRAHPAFLSTCPATLDIVDFFCRQANMNEKRINEILRDVKKAEESKN